jgi:anthranilate synthase component 1
MITLKKFQKLAEDYNLIPLDEKIIADTETPVSVLQRFRDQDHSFLLESVEGQERWAQYSFIGFRPLEMFRSKGNIVETKGRKGDWKRKKSTDPLSDLDKMIRKYKVATLGDQPRFSGGAVGYVGYDMIRFIERMPRVKQVQTDPWECFFIIPQVLLVFDNREHSLRVIYHVPVSKGSDLKKLYDTSRRDISDIINVLRKPVVVKQTHPNKVGKAGSFRPLWNKSSFLKAVRQTQEYIRAGDCIQTVLSLRFRKAFSGDSFDIYRALRRLNPSPYLFYLHMDDHDVVGASPETMVHLEDGELTLRPIAGTRPRGQTEKEDLEYEKDLLSDPKECAEHVMLVDLGRNDLGRVSEKGSVDVNEFMLIERYSHVMHIVSNVRGKLKEKKSAIDVLRAAFPAGTLSGAPKVRAMEIIYEFEPTKRGVYGGCVGYIDFCGNMDTAIAIRTALVHDGQVFIQAGAGIVVDSKPANEYEECMNKARGVIKAVEIAEKGL